MTIRKYFGLKRETPCDCGCGQRMPAREDIAVMVDRDSYPPKRYIPGHEPGARTPAKSAPAPSPAPPTPGPAGPTPLPPTPVVEPSPSPAPKPSEGLTSSLADNRPWSIIQVTVSVGPYESVKVGSADFGTENESLAQLRERIAKEVGSELDRQVRSLQVLHQGSTGTTKGVGSLTSPTLSPAKAGTLQASQSTPTSAAHSVGPLPAGTIARGMEKYWVCSGRLAGKRGFVRFLITA